MFKSDLRKQPRFLRYKKLHRGSFKIICYNLYKNNMVYTYKRRSVGFIAKGPGFYNWKTVYDFKKRIGRIFKKRKYFCLYLNFSLEWCVSNKTHKSRMGKGKGVVTVDDWRTRVRSGKFLMFLYSKKLISRGLRLRLWRNTISLPVSTSIVLFD